MIVIKFLYLLLCQLIYVISNLFSLKIFPRNSLILGYFSGTRSDIDLTLLYSSKKFKRAQRISSFLTTFLPMVKEINAYRFEDIRELSINMNSLERLRDPKLCEYIGEMKITSEDSIVFLSRMILSDYENLSKDPSRRREKWKHHLKLCGLSLESNPSIDALCTTLHSLVPPYLQHEVSFRKVLSAHEIPIENWDFFKDPNLLELLIGDFSTGLRLIANKNINWKEVISDSDLGWWRGVLESQLRWEIWGVYTQHLSIQSPDHKALLKEFALILNNKEILSFVKLLEI